MLNMSAFSLTQDTTSLGTINRKAAWITVQYCVQADWNVSMQFIEGIFLQLVQKPGPHVITGEYLNTGVDFVYCTVIHGALPFIYDY
jgi:hypothetical protein